VSEYIKYETTKKEFTTKRLYCKMWLCLTYTSVTVLTGKIERCFQCIVSKHTIGVRR